MNTRNDNSEANNNDLIAPCRCKGTSKWVHRKCLDQWRAYNAQDLAFSQCMECHYCFQFEANPQGSKEKQPKRSRRLLYWFLVSRDVLVLTAVVQIFILFFALLFWLAARNEEGVIEWANEQEPICVSTGCQFWSCYAVGLLVLFFCLGVYGSVLLCLHNCSVREAIYAGGGVAPSRSGPIGNANTVPHGHCGDLCSGCGNTCNGFGGCDGGDAGAICLIILLMVGVVLTIIGFFVAAIVSVVISQMIIRRHFWVLQKQSLVKDYQVRDLADDPAALEATTTTTTTTPDNNPQPRVLEQIERQRLTKLGLLAEN